ncbi:flavodoxin [Bacillus sp. SD088]|uniref:flavodoxin n=1 Tax=Bacillus sp. SD088 TaxID=2782012 RepID=UPI001A963889|nr:flavodoxin [Bacillus sp. SD088]MBO0995147.1 flavodoxin [Bacillus sp. SD088]
MVRILICYASYSGNTKEVAELINHKLQQEGICTEQYWIGTGRIPDPAAFDAMLIGTFTWDRGGTPEEIKEFVYEIGYKPPSVFVFGTGDTQFGGDDLFCHAAVKLAKFYHSPLPPLKIEQSPRGSQEEKVIRWTEGVIKHCPLHLVK